MDENMLNSRVYGMDLIFTTADIIFRIVKNVIRVILNCQDNNHITNSVPGCSPSMMSPRNGMVSCSNSIYVGSRCTYLCSTGYKLSNGSTLRMCEWSTNSSHWTGSQPTCSREFMNTNINWNLGWFCQSIIIFCSNSVKEEIVYINISCMY